MWISLFLIGCLLAVNHHAVAEPCPAQCHCSANQAACTDASLRLVPPHLPHSLTSLDLSRNLIEHVTYTALTSLRNLVDLSLSENELTSIDESALSSQGSLQTLDLSHNHLTTVTPQVFTPVASTLTDLNLAHNQLAHLDGSLTELTQLVRLDLRHNRLRRVSAATLRGLEALRYLHLENNAITHLDRRAFRGLTQLTQLVLRANPLGAATTPGLPEVDSAFLSFVDVSECGLGAVPRGLPASLRYLQLRRNNISELTPRDFADTPYLSILVLDENSISAVTSDTFASLTYLQQLWLNGNHLPSIPATLPPSLTRLLMDQNDVTRLRRGDFPPHSQLATLSLTGNAIEAVDHDALSDVTQLESLDLSNNRISQLYGQTFSNLSSLRQLHLSKNPLTHLHSRALWGLGGLVNLSLAYTDTHVAVHPDAFADLVTLQRLELDSSPQLIRSLLATPALRVGLARSVRTLSMKHSELTSLTDAFPSYWPHLQHLSLSSARWHCDSHLLWLRDWPGEGSGVTMDTGGEPALCYSPPVLHGRPLHSLADDEFVRPTSTSQSPVTSPIQFTTFKSRLSPAPTLPVASTHAPSIDEDSEGGDDEGEEGEASGDAPYRPRGHPHVAGGGDPLRDPFYGSADDERRHIDFDWDAWLSETYHNGGGGRGSEGGGGEGGGDGGSDSGRGAGGDRGSGADRTTKRPRHSPAHPSSTPSTPSPPSPPRPALDSTHHSLGSSLTDPSHVTVVIAAVTGATAVIAAIIIAFIVYFVRKHRAPATSGGKPAPSPPSPDKSEPYQNGVPLKHNSQVHYFLPPAHNGSAPQHTTTTLVMTSPCDVTSGSMSDSTRTLSSGRSGSQRTKEHVTLLPKQSPARDVMARDVTTGRQHVTFMPGRDVALIPGRDVNHEGPMRVYKWEDF